HLISATCDQLLLVADGHCKSFDGDLDDYARWLTTRDKPASAKKEKEGAPQSAKDRRKANADERALRDKVSKLDTQLSKLHAQLKQIDERLADPAIYSGDKAELSKAQKEQTTLRERIATVEHDWLTAADQLEALGS